MGPFKRFIWWNSIVCGIPSYSVYLKPLQLPDILRTQKIKIVPFVKLLNFNLEYLCIRKSTCPFTFTDVLRSNGNREKDSGKLIDCVKFIVGPNFDPEIHFNCEFEVLIILLENSIKHVIMIFWMFQNRLLRKK